MAFAALEKRNAYEKRRNLLRNASGLCRRCPLPRLENHALCAACNRKENERQPEKPGKAAWTIGKQDYRRSLLPRLYDRRQNGHQHACLAWALRMYEGLRSVRLPMGDGPSPGD